jgi:hypothetical protein
MNQHVRDKHLARRRLCESFLNNPGINPETGKKLIYGKGPYNTYIAMCKKYNISTASLTIYDKDVNHPSQKGYVPTDKHLESSTPSHYVLPSGKSTNSTSSSRQSYLPEGFTRIKELDLAILLNLDMPSLYDMRFTSKWINSLLNSRSFLDDYNALYNLCPFKRYNKFSELYQINLIRYKNPKKYLTDCLAAVRPDNVDRILDFIEDITLGIGSFQHDVLRPIARYGKKESLLQGLNMYFVRFGNDALEGTIGLILRNAAETGNIDVITEVLSNYSNIFDEIDLAVFKTASVSLYLDIALGAAIGNNYDILKNALEKIIDTGALGMSGNYDKIIGEIFDLATDHSDTTEDLLLRTLNEVGIDTEELDTC